MDCYLEYIKISPNSIVTLKKKKRSVRKGAADVSMKGYTDGKEAREKMFTIISHEGDAN